ncbi:MAG: DUF2169 domain-containing protein [Pseudomonadota bacterium]
MKVIKDDNQSLLLNRFYLENKHYLAVSVLTFFSLDQPETPLPEWEMWPFVQNELGPDAVFDAAMPKPKAEVLLKAHCFAPSGKPTRAAMASFRLGRLEKSLLVFGARRWEKKTGVVWVITAPEPFTQMEISYHNAFGGPGFPWNPVGKGFAPIGTPGGAEFRPLPNIEDPKKNIGSPDDRPFPAGFGPHDQSWPQRASKLGTYDKKWLRTAWPFFPDDLNWTFFNTAPEDQQMEGFFQGDETCAFENLHPQKPRLESRLPGLRQRCFVRVNSGADRELIFKEVKTRLNTVWFFPRAERGVAIFRGLVSAIDDEASDMANLFLAQERLRDPLKDQQFYLEKLEKALDRRVRIDPAPLEEAKKVLEGALARLKKLPQTVERETKTALGQAPSAPMSVPEMTQEARERIQQGVSRLKEAEIGLADLRSKYGHLIKIDAGPLQDAQAGAGQAMLGLDKVVADFDHAQGRADDLKKNIRDALAGAPARQRALVKKQMDPNDIPARPVENPWASQALSFLDKCRKNLDYDTSPRSRLQEAGFSDPTIDWAWLGRHPAPEKAPRADWGLKPAAGALDLDLPAGLVIPMFEGPTPKKIVVLPDWETDPARSLTIEGSAEEPFCLDLGPEKPVVRTKNELEAWLVSQEIGDLCAGLAWADPGRPLSPPASTALEQTPVLLLISDNAMSARELEAWRKLAPRVPVRVLVPPRGSNLLSAKKHGWDVRKWITDALPSDLGLGLGEEEQTKPDAEKSNKFDLPGIEAIIQGTRGQISAAAANSLAEISALKNHIPEQIEAGLIKAGHNPEEFLSTGDPLPEGNPFKSGMVSEAFAQARRSHEKFEPLSPEQDAILAESETRITAVMDKSAMLHEEGLARLEEAAKPLSWSESDQAAFAAMGVDLDDRAPLTREKVIELYRQGRSLAGTDLAGLDLSGLDLTGADLARANLQGANFKKTNLDNANLAGTIANDADFSEGSFQKTNLARGIFKNAKFIKGNLAGADFARALVSQADLTGASLVGAVLDGATIEEANLDRTDLSGASAKNCLFLRTRARQARFVGMNAESASFIGSDLEETDFSGSRLTSVMFHETRGGNNKFKAADLVNSRLLKGSSFPDSDFSEIKLEKSYWGDCDLSGSDFTAARLHRATLEKCDLSRAKMPGVSARECRFEKSDLDQADLRGINLFRGSLRKARLTETDLRAANLYSVEFFKAGMGKTKLEGANLKMTLLQGREDLLP